MDPTRTLGVRITPDSFQFEWVGQETTFSGTVVFEGSAPDAPPLSFRSLDSTVVTVGANGRAQAVGAGETAVIVSHSEWADTATVTVEQIPEELAAQTQRLVFLSLSDTIKATVMVRDRGGAEVPGATLSWEVEDTSVAVVLGDGLVVGRSAGETTLTASVGALQVDIGVSVLPDLRATVGPDSVVFFTSGRERALSIVVSDQEGRDLTDLPVAWVSRDSMVATVDSGGIVRAAGLGETQVVAEVGGATDSVHVDVRLYPTAISLSILKDSLAWIGDTTRVVVQAADSAGTSFVPPGVQWTMDPAGVVRVDEEGLVIAVSNGVVSLAGQVGQLADTLEVVVSQVPASLSLTPGSPTVLVGRVDSLSAVVKDQGGTEIPAPTVRWASRDSLVVAVDSLGETVALTARQVGTVWVVATAMDLSDSVSVDVTETVAPSGGSKVSSSDDHACVLRGGEAWCWGANGGGELGDGTRNHSLVPKRVQGGGVYASISAGRRQTCAVTTDGFVECWGSLNYESAPDHPYGQHFTPFRMPLPSKAAQVSVGHGFACALLATGRAYCWGEDPLLSNTHGQHGPLEIPSQDFVQISVGASRCGVTTKGSIECHSYRHHYQEFQNPDSFVEVDVSWNGACGRHASGAVSCWWSTPWGSSVEPEVISGLTGVLSVGTGNRLACVQRGDQTLACADQSTPSGGASSSSLTPLPGGHQFTEFDVSTRLGCGIAAGGDVWCWGGNLTGGLGVGEAPFSPFRIVVPGVSVDVLTAGPGNTCVVALDDEVLCSTAGASPGARSLEPIPVSGLSDPVDMEAFGHTCVLGGDGILFCWGHNFWRELGRETAGDFDPLPGPADTPLRFTQVSVGEDHTCAIGRDGETYCWGSDNHGILGRRVVQGQRDGVPTPVDGDHEFLELFSRTRETVGIKADDSAWIWGDGHVNGDFSPHPLFPDLRFRNVGPGWEHFCGVLVDGSGVCWGDGWSGELGSGFHGGHTHSPTPVSGNYSWTAIEASESFSCGLTTGGAVYCWGGNGVGQLGVGDYTPRGVPERVDLPQSAVDLKLGRSHACAVLADRSLVCWGRNVEGQLGVSPLLRSAAPLRVLFP